MVKSTLERDGGIHVAIIYSSRDAMVRTGGEQRLSDFMLWEIAYAELYFTDIAWPDFGEAALREAVSEFGRRQRRFGGLRSFGGSESIHFSAVAS